MILIRLDPSAIRASTKAYAPSGSSSVGIGTPVLRAVLLFNRADTDTGGRYDGMSADESQRVPNRGFLAILLFRAHFVETPGVEAWQPNEPSEIGLQNELRATPSVAYHNRRFG
jgi:hypothetical protein